MNSGWFVMLLIHLDNLLAICHQSRISALEPFDKLRQTQSSTREFYSAMNLRSGIKIACPFSAVYKILVTVLPSLSSATEVWRT